MAAETPAIIRAFTAHASLAAPSWAILFPLGAILIRVVPSSKAWVIHAGVMLFTLTLFTSAVGIGIWRTLADGYTIASEGHTLLGICIFSIVWTQPLTGLFHHFVLKKYNYRTLASAMHTFIGRLLITAGMINGGLGLLLGKMSSRAENIAYGVICGVVWVTYFLLSFHSEAKRSTRGHRAVLALAERTGGKTPSLELKKSDELE